MINTVLPSEKLYFSDFTLLIFDECHHASAGNHPYRGLILILSNC